jgi:NAD(P)-dependent dehydrogenase (short-subunit alcohol dehydrogenase family)
MRIDDVVEEVCLITGASRGIRAAAARGLAAAGMRIGVHYYRSGVAEAKAVAADIAAVGGETVLLSGDIAEPGTMKRLVQEMAGFCHEFFAIMDYACAHSENQLASE